MTTTVKAMYANGVFTPLEPVDLDEGAEVTVSVDGGATRRGLAGIADRVRALHASMPPGAEDNLPTDLSRNKKHYLYGHPREGED